VAGLGLVSVVSAATPASRQRLHFLVELLPRFAPESARAATIAVGVVLLMLAGGLRRRKRRAWLVAVALAGLACVLHLVKGLDVEESTVCAAVVVLLLGTREAFAGVPDPRTWRHVLVMSAGAASAAVLAGLATLGFDQEALRGHTSLRLMLEHVLLGMVGLQGPVQFRTGERAGEVAVTLALLGTVVVAVTVATLLHPAGGPTPLDPANEIRLRALLGSGRAADSLSYFALRRDKSVIFSPSGKAAVAYRVLGGVCLASGDPIGDREAWPAAIEEWLAQARRYAWTPAVLAASESGAQAYSRAGLDALEFGDEAVLDVAGFTLEGREMRTVRQGVNRARRQGYSCDIRRVDTLTPDELGTVRELAARWRAGGTERGFTMALGRLGDPADSGCVLVRARNDDDELCALLHLVPWGAHGWSLELMRRHPNLGNGVMELMVAELMAAAGAHRVEQVSLNFAVFRSVFERGGRLGAGPVLRLWRRVLLAASRVWQLESLYQANAKYRPRWQPRFLCFVAARDLPRVGVAALEAEAFIVAPWRRRRAAADVDGRGIAGIDSRAAGSERVAGTHRRSALGFR
jgi:lysyl-tRNA synthetase class 2